MQCYALPLMTSKGWMCVQEVARILEETFALVKDQPDAIKLYGSNPSKGLEYNSLFRKTFSRKLNEVMSFCPWHAFA